jgi:sulfotransferase family protein
VKFLGVGLSKTGTSSLHYAFQSLKLRSIHYDRRRLYDVVMGRNPHPDFRIYDDVDAVCDLPSACFYEEFLAAYPDLRFILTVRDEDSWWASMEQHLLRNPVPSEREDPFIWKLRHFAYGTATAAEFIYRKKYREHNQRVIDRLPAERLLVMNIVAGDGWEPLCRFMGRPVPAVPFPVKHVTPGGSATDR